MPGDQRGAEPQRAVEQSQACDQQAQSQPQLFAQQHGPRHGALEFVDQTERPEGEESTADQEPADGDRGRADRAGDRQRGNGFHGLHRNWAAAGHSGRDGEDAEADQLPGRVVASQNEQSDDHRQEGAEIGEGARDVADPRGAAGQHVRRGAGSGLPHRR